MAETGPETWPYTQTQPLTQTRTMSQGLISGLSPSSFLAGFSETHYLKAHNGLFRSSQVGSSKFLSIFPPTNCPRYAVWPEDEFKERIPVWFSAFPTSLTLTATLASNGWLAHIPLLSLCHLVLSSGLGLTRVSPPPHMEASLLPLSAQCATCS
jgi:hypothetical protein